MMNAECIIAHLESLEPAFVRAGQAALRMQKGIKYYSKLETGDPAVDIVTEADLATQEAVLTAMRSTPLVGCRLLAEEDTESVKLFAPESNLYIGIDPIDGTAIYARGGANVYDGCVEYVIASGRAQPVYSDSMSGNLQLSDIRRREKGLYYPGHYLVLSNPLE